MNKNPATLDHAGIAARVPHAGRMCLLDTLLAWSDQHICCSASSHQDPAHPLRSGGVLSAACGIEYAAQAMALHGGLMAGVDTGGAHGTTPPSAGFLASARNVTLHVPRLDDVPGPLRIEATRLAGDSGQALYRFSLHADSGALLVEGRATVVLNSPLAAPSIRSTPTPNDSPNL